MGIGTKVERDALKAAAEELAPITGQQPIVTKARKSISNFKLREGMPIGAKVTLRGERMYEFLDRLINVGAAAHPRLPRGVRRAVFDGRGNYTLGLEEQTIFPEIDPDKIKRDAGHGHHDCDHGRDGRRGARAAGAAGMPFAK